MVWGSENIACSMGSPLVPGGLAPTRHVLLSRLWLYRQFRCVFERSSFWSAIKFRQIGIKTIRTSRTKCNIYTAFYKGEDVIHPRITLTLTNWYERKSCVAGCEVANTVFCSPCLLFHPDGHPADSTEWVTLIIISKIALSEIFFGSRHWLLHMIYLFNAMSIQ